MTASDTRTRTNQIFLPNGDIVNVKRDRRFQFSIQQKIDKEWVSTAADATILCSTVAASIGTALTSFDGASFAGFVILVIALIVKLCR